MNAASPEAGPCGPPSGVEAQLFSICVQEEIENHHMLIYISFFFFKNREEIELL